LVELDTQQLPGVSRDYITIDKSVSVYDGGHGVTMSCPDAPLVQVGDFNFGKEQKTIDKKEKPLLLAWPLNNYWDTNFRARQPGFVSFRYILSTFSSFNPVNTIISATRAVSSVLSSPVVDCKEESVGQFVEVSEDCVQIFDLKPVEEGKGVIVRLINHSDQEVNTTLRFPNRMIETAFRTNVLEEIQSEISRIEKGFFRVNLEAKQMQYINVILKENLG
jgi:alpha-mannosidase